MGRVRRHDEKQILDLYLNSTLTIKQIREKLNISSGRLSAYLYGENARDKKYKRRKGITEKYKVRRVTRIVLTPEQRAADNRYARKTGDIKRKLKHYEKRLLIVASEQEKEWYKNKVDAVKKELTEHLLKFNERLAA